MSSSRLAGLLTGLRLGVFAIGITVTALTVFRLATVPPPPPGSDEFATGMTIYGSAIMILSLGGAAISIILPTMVGWDDPLGFTRRQRTVLRGAGGLIGGGFSIAAVYGFVSILPSGLFVWLIFVVFAAGLVCLTLCWRTVTLLGERNGVDEEEL